MSIKCVACGRDLAQSLRRRHTVRNALDWSQTLSTELGGFRLQCECFKSYGIAGSVAGATEAWINDLLRLHDIVVPSHVLPVLEDREAVQRAFDETYGATENPLTLQWLHDETLGLVFCVGDGFAIGKGMGNALIRRLERLTAAAPTPRAGRTKPSSLALLL